MELIDELKNLVVSTNSYHIFSNSGNKIIDNLFNRLSLHCSEIIDRTIGTTYPFQIYPYYPHFEIKNDKLLLSLFYEKSFNDFILDKFSVGPLKYLPGTEEDIPKFINNGLRNIKTLDELKDKYPKIYEVYLEIVGNCENKQKVVNRAIINSINYDYKDEIIIKSYKYAQDFSLFINDISNYYLSIYNNQKEIYDNLNRDLFSCAELTEEEICNFIFKIIVDIITIRNMIGTLENDFDVTKKIYHCIDLLDKYNYNLSILGSSGHNMTLDKLKSELIDGGVIDVLESRDNDQSLPTLNKPVTFPFLYNDSTIIFPEFNSKDDYLYFASLNVILMFSGLFEYGYDLNDKKEVVVGLKDEYADKSIDELIDITIFNLRKVKEKDINCFNVIKYENNEVYSQLVKYGLNESSVLKFFNNHDKDFIRSFIKKNISEIVNMQMKISVDDKRDSIDFLNAYNYYTLKQCKSMPTDVLIIGYVLYLKNIQGKNIFVKFINKKNLQQKDFEELLDEVEDEILSRIGPEKMDEIIEKLQNAKPGDDAKNIVNSCLVEKKSIDDEINDIKKLKEKTLKSDPTYAQLNQRLNKLLLYKEHFDTKEVVNGSGVFKDYYGFEFDGVLVFDYFADSEENKDVYSKAKKDYGNAIYILSVDDYKKVKDLKNKMEVRRFINSNLRPCADYLVHSENTEEKLMSKVMDVSLSIKKRELIYNLAHSDNPVTDEEITLTQDEMDLYVSKFLDENEEELLNIRDKSSNSKFRETINKKYRVKIVEKEKEKDETKTNLTDEDRKEIDHDIDLMLVDLEKLNLEREKDGLKPLSFDKDNFYDVYTALIDYKKKNKKETKTIRDPQVAYKTKERAFYDGLYHCELCGKEGYIPSRYESHHFIPICECGPDDIYNTVCLCLECHSDIHHGLVTDYQKYSLIQTIKRHIEKENPEVIDKFEKTLGFSNNFYSEKLDELDNEKESLVIQQEEAFNLDVSEDEILRRIDDIENEKDLLEKQKDLIAKQSNRFLDYYRKY